MEECRVAQLLGGASATDANAVAKQVPSGLHFCASILHSYVLSWLIAAYTAQLVSAHPSRGAELFQHTGLIAGANKDFKPSAWLKYNLAFCRCAAADHYLQSDFAGTYLWLLCFTDVNLARNVICYHCGPSGHIRSYAV